MRAWRHRSGPASTQHRWQPTRPTRSRYPKQVQPSAMTVRPAVRSHCMRHACDREGRPLACRTFTALPSWKAQQSPDSSQYRLCQCAPSTPEGVKGSTLVTAWLLSAPAALSGTSEGGWTPTGTKAVPLVGPTLFRGGGTESVCAVQVLGKPPVTAKPTVSGAHTLPGPHAAAHYLHVTLRVE